MTQEKLSLRQEIEKRLRHDRLCAISNSAATGLAAGTAILIPGLWAIAPMALAAWCALGIADALWDWRRHRNALRIYDRNPVAAYAAEIRHAFGCDQS